jgi:hypothetical protein
MWAKLRHLPGQCGSGLAPLGSMRRRLVQVQAPLSGRAFALHGRSAFPKSGAAVNGWILGCSSDRYAALTLLLPEADRWRSALGGSACSIGSCIRNPALLSESHRVNAAEADYSVLKKKGGWCSTRTPSCSATWPSPLPCAGRPTGATTTCRCCPRCSVASCRSPTAT